jgi:hypothetical protein
VREQEMLDDDRGFGEIAVEICTRTVPQFRSASGVNGAMQGCVANSLGQTGRAFIVFVQTR